MARKIFDIIPPGMAAEKVIEANLTKSDFVRLERNNPQRLEIDFDIIKNSAIKIMAVALILSLNWTGLSAVIETIAYFNNTENSSGNVFQAGILDFELQSLNDFPEVCSDEPTERTISLVNYGNPFKYVASSAGFSGEICDYVTLEANVDGGEPEYVGPLTGFNYGPLDFSEPDDWVFKATFNSDLPAGLLSQTCNFKFVFDGSQIKNDLPFGQGFSDTEEIISNITAKACCYTEIRSCGYWKTHSNVYKNLLPQTLGGYPTDEIVDTVTKANNILTAACGDCGCKCDKTMRDKLKGQLLAMKFNIAYFGIGEYVVEGEGKTLNELVAEADNLLRQNPPPSDSVLEEMKNLLDYLNNLGKIRFCAVVPPPPDECQLQLTKTASAGEVKPGETITYHFTFDNVGGKVCTGGGVRLKDVFDKSLLKYLDYTSSRNPKSFSKGLGYVEWNFGNIYPEDPLIEIGLRMKVAECVECGSIITNSAKYWSNETNWGQPVTADTQVVCESAPETGVVINEFLPNPVGSDNAPKPDGEWVELYNKGDADVDVAGWVLYDSHDDHELAITTANTDTGDTVVGAGGFLVVYRNSDGDFALNNTGGDTVRLYDGEISSSANLIDSHIYTIDALAGKSFARIPDGSDVWVDPLPTPGEPNVLEEEEIVFGPALPEEGEEGYEDLINEEEIPMEEETSVLSEATEETAEGAPAEEVIGEEASTGNENEPEQGIIETVDEIIDTIDEAIDAVVDEIIDEIIPDESANEPAESVETSKDDFVVEDAIIEPAPIEETVAIEPAPATEEQAVIVPSNDSDVSPSNDSDVVLSGGDSSGENGVGGGEIAPGDSSLAPAAEASSVSAAEVSPDN